MRIRPQFGAALGFCLSYSFVQEKVLQILGACVRDTSVGCISSSFASLEGRGIILGCYSFGGAFSLEFFRGGWRNQARRPVTSRRISRAP